MRVSRFTKCEQARWDSFVKNSKNGTFLLLGDYMHYHADRFHDHSLLFWDKNDRLVAVMPANEKDQVLVSHGGLTYGGIITDTSMSTGLMLQVFDELIRYMQDQSFGQLLYKTIPHIYHRFPAEEDRYALFRNNARLVRRDVLTVIAQGERIPYQERRRRKIKQATKAGLRVSVSTDFTEYWNLLAENLQRVHGVLPVHDLVEIQLLQSRFPESIRLYLCQDDLDILAGVVVYETERVAHLQYIASSGRGREIGALDFLLAHLVEHEYPTSPYFDFGISNEQDGRYLNEGLIQQKEGFGARAVVHDFYELNVA